MKIYTSSYFKYHGNRGVQISTSKPELAKVYRKLPSLYPSWECVKRWNEVKKLPKTDPERQEVWSWYVEQYWNKLTRMGAENILPYLCEGDVLLCWCKNRNECHRGVLASWLAYYGVEVEEIDW